MQNELETIISQTQESLEASVEPPIEEQDDLQADEQASQDQVEAHGEPSDDQGDTPSNEDQSELDALRSEISSLKAELEHREAAIKRMSEELSEFSELYPERPLSALPGEVWDSVRGGLPLAAAVALYEAKKQRREALAAEVNSRNSTASSGGISGGVSDYFSPDEVRKMSPEQVRRNYSKILDSMKLWS